MSKELIIRSRSSAVDFALLKDGKLVEFHKEVEDNKFHVGDIFLAKIKKTLSGLNAAFVDVGYKKASFSYPTSTNAAFKPDRVFLIFAKKISPT